MGCDKVVSLNLLQHVLYEVEKESAAYEVSTQEDPVSTPQYFAHSMCSAACNKFFSENKLSLRSKI